MELDEELKQSIIDLIRQGKPIPIAYKNLLFPLGDKAQEIELIYGIKERKEDVLADTMSVPFQAVKKFANVKEGEWHNKLIFADNIQALKFMLKDPEIKGKVKLIYIDPPFGTGELYDANGVPAYSAALQGAEFVEFLRKRLILLRKLLADDGSIYVRIDYHFGHYIKVIMDEIFGKNNIRNEIVVKRGKVQFGITNKYNVATDSLFFYTKSDNYFFRKYTRERYEHEPKMTNMLLKGERKPRERTFYDENGKPHILIPPPNTHWKFIQKKLDDMQNKGLIVLKKSSKGLESDVLEKKKDRLIKTDIMPYYYFDMPKSIDSNWTDISGYSQTWNYPTENSEQLLERVILTSTKEGDLVLDCFAGSGTTGAVAEKLGRKWIMIDSSKLAIYTMIKRMFNLRKEISNKGKPLKPNPFVLYNAGLYEDHSFILNIGKDQYKQFAMELFQVEPKKLEINGLEMDGVLFNCPVKIFSQKGYLTEEFVDELHGTVGEQLKGRMFIIAPASRVYFLQDYIEKDGVRYYVLRIPYSVIDELHKRAFKRPMQPTSSTEINQLIEQVGFDFIHPPSVKAAYYRRKPKDKLIDQELVIEIKEFKAVQRSKEPVEFKNPKDALSMVLMDRNYNGEYFNMTDYFFRKELEKEEWKARIPGQLTGKRIMIIYLDIFGNERVEVRSSEDFKMRS
jgi:site-specific DNA-methyltransferase (adenine-specific)/adenine-specific DNA-methyltransferase